LNGPRLVAVGDLLLDVSVRGSPGHDAHVSVRAGGSAANVAVWAAHLGASATVLGRVGGDLAGRAVREALEQRNVDVRVAVDPALATGTFVLVNSERFVDRGASARFSPDELPETIEADIVVVSPYLPRAAADAVVRRARAEWVVALGRQLRGAGGVILSEDEAEVGVHVLGAQYRLACVTLGRLGALAMLDGEERSAPAPVVETGEATGAGDAFAAALLVAVARGSSLSDALEDACRVGAEAAASPTAWPVVK
jgi:ribokinase